MKIEFSDEEVREIIEQRVHNMLMIKDSQKVVAKSVDGLYRGLAAIVTIENRAEEKADES